MIKSYEMSREQQSCKVSVNGAFTAELVPELKRSLQQELLQETREVVFDLRATGMLDSSGIGLLIATFNTLRARQATVEVINASPEIFGLLSNMRLVTRLNVTACLEER